MLVTSFSQKQLPDAYIRHNHSDQILRISYYVLGVLTILAGLLASFIFYPYVVNYVFPITTSGLTLGFVFLIIRYFQKSYLIVNDPKYTNQLESRNEVTPENIFGNAGNTCINPNKKIKESERNINNNDNIMEIGENPFKQIPPEVHRHIFSFLNPKELCRCILVNKEWQQNAEDSSLWQTFDLKKISPQIKTFDENDWIRYADPKLGLDVSDAKPLNKRIVIPKLFKFLSACQIVNKAGITLLTVPKNLNFTLLKKFSESPLHGVSISFNSKWFIYLNCLAKRGKIKEPNPKTYRVIITNGRLENSEFFFNSSAAFNSLKENTFPDVLSMSALLTTSYISDEKSLLFKDLPKTYILCCDKDKVLKNFNFYVGNFKEKGFKAYVYPMTFRKRFEIGYAMQTELTDEDIFVT